MLVFMGYDECEIILISRTKCRCAMDNALDACIN